MTARVLVVVEGVSCSAVEGIAASSAVEEAAVSSHVEEAVVCQVVVYVD